MLIQGKPHIKKEGAYMLGAAFGVDVPHELVEREIESDPTTGEVLRALFRMTARWQGREVTMTGACERKELQGEKTDHNVITKAETRCYKRVVLAVLGSADPIADEE